MISWFMSSSPTSDSVLTAQSLEPASDSVSPSVSAPPPLILSLLLSLSLSLSLSNINKPLKKKNSHYYTPLPTLDTIKLLKIVPSLLNVE